jgi:hypothetical protein
VSPSAPRSHICAGCIAPIQPFDSSARWLDGEVSRLPLSGWKAFERGWFAVDKTRQHAGSHR